MLQYFPNITGSLTVSGDVIVSGSIATTQGITISGSIDSASYSSNSEKLDNLDSTAFVFTSSFNTYSSSMSTRTSNLESTSSVLTTASASFAVVSSSYSVASGSLSTRVTRIEGNYATTGSNVFMGAQTVCANITSTGTIIAQTLNVQQVTSSIVYSSGSNTFGCLTTDRQQFTGSVTMTGSLAVFTAGTSPEFQVVSGGTIKGNALTDVHQVTGSLRITGSVASFSVGCTGIGIATPVDRLHVSGNIISEGCFFSGAPDNLRIFAGHWSTVSGNSNCYLVLQAGGGSAAFGTPQGWGGTASIYTCNQTRLSIDTNGIASFSCQVCAPRLEILRSGANNGLFIYSNAGATPISCTMVQINGLTNDSTGNILTLGSLNAGIRMIVRNDGNVAIGASTSVGKLDIATGGNTNVVISNDSTDTGYNIVSLNGTRTKGSYAGIAGGGTGDNRLYLNSGVEVVIQTGASYTARMRTFSTGETCFSNNVCAQRFIGPLSGTVNGYPILAQASCALGGASSDVTIYFTSNFNIAYGVNDYTVMAYATGNSADQSNLRALIPYNYYASSLSTTNLASYIDTPNSHSALAIAICKLGSSNTYCIAVRFAKSSGNVSGYTVTVISNGIAQGG